MMRTKLGAAALAATFLLAATALPAVARERFFGYCINPTTGAHVASCTATVYEGGSLYLRVDGGPGSTLYVCEVGSWAAK